MKIAGQIAIVTGGASGLGEATARELAAQGAKVAVLDRQQVTAYMTDSHASNFTSNILTLLLEARLGLAVFDPAGVCSVTFDYVP